MVDVYKRFYPFEEDFRDPFSRDRDRIIHCGSFRRLEYKTQVFLNHEGDYFRTRLTHSLEVSQIARTIANYLELNVTLAEAIALSHDLGHTPFGHVGGDVLDDLLKKSGIKNGFEHNYQSFRVLTLLEKRYKNFDGLNLTYATLEGVLKHSYPYDKPFIPDIVRDYFHMNYHPSLEAMVVDCADEIAYTSHDIDDGIKYQLIDFDTLLGSPLSKRVDYMVGKEGVSRSDGKLYRHRFVAALIKILVEDLINNSKQNSKELKSDKPLCSQIEATEPVAVSFSTTIAKELKMLKKLLRQKLYLHQKIVRKMHAGKECVRALYRAFNEDYTLMPQSMIEALEYRSQHRVVADYIASMTDRYAMKSYHEVYGISLH